MAAKTRFTFKRHKRETGLAGMARRPSVDIKLKKKVVGAIHPPISYMESHRWWKILLHVADDNSSGWRNAILKAKFDTEEEAREWLQTNAERLLTLNLVCPDDLWEARKAAEQKDTE